MNVPLPACIIHPGELAFDIDGVVADTMDVFVNIARDRFGFADMTKDDISCYDLYSCLGIEKVVLDEIICLTLDDEHTLQIPPMPGAPEFLTEMGRTHPLRFVTARIWPESITEWLYQTLPEVSRENIKVIASGAPELKPQILNDMGVNYFVEDRIETCHRLKAAGIQPLLFVQPWNRNAPHDGFIRVENWTGLKEWVLPPDTCLR